MNQVFLAIIAVSFVTAAFAGSMGEVSAAALESAKSAVDLSLSLIGYMALFLGIMKVAEVAGLLRLLARAIEPVMIRLFPDVPANHPAMGAMILNISANMLGLANAATPFGIKAIQELDTLNEDKGTATNAMVLFLAINTSGLALLPTGVVSVRAANGSADPWGIMAPTLAATACSTIAGIMAAKMLCRLPIFARTAPAPSRAAVEGKTPDLPGLETENTWAVRGLSLFLVLSLLALVIPPLGAAILPESASGDGGLRESFLSFSATSGDWVIPVLITSLLGFGYARGVPVYETFVEGAKEGFETAVRIIPYLVAILVAVGMFRASGAMGVLTSGVGQLTAPLGLPGEALPMALVRPLSGSGAFALMSELIATHGPDSYIGYVASVLQGSTETTFYVLAVYFGAVGVTRARHAVAAGLTADLVGVLAGTAVCAALFGHLV